MNSNIHSDCIITQVHIPNHDVQGNLPYIDKIKLVEFGLEHLRRFNPNAYIIITGHGHKPSNLGVADYSYWNDNHEPLNEHGYVINMPAQYKYVYAGLAHAKERGYKKVLKTRGDCIIGHPNICQVADKMLGDKHLLITQQTGPERMGDCFMYGDTDLLCKIWDANNPVYDPDGLQNTAHHFRRATGLTANWIQLLLKWCVLKDVDTLLFTCLRWNYYNLDKLSDNIKQKLCDPGFDFKAYHWGKANGWINFNNERDMFGSDRLSYSEKQFLTYSSVAQ